MVSADQQKGDLLKGAMIALGLFILLWKLVLPAYDYWRFPDLPLSIQPSSEREAASLVRTIVRQADCDLEEAGFLIPGRGFVDSLCYQRFESEIGSGMLNVTIQTFFNKKQVEKEIEKLSKYYPFLLVGDYYIISATYWEDGFDSLESQPNIAPSVEEYSLLHRFPRKKVYLSPSYEKRSMYGGSSI